MQRRVGSAPWEQRCEHCSNCLLPGGSFYLLGDGDRWSYDGLGSRTLFLSVVEDIYISSAPSCLSPDGGNARVFTKAGVNPQLGAYL